MRYAIPLTAILTLALAGLDYWQLPGGFTASVERSAVAHEPGRKPAAPKDLLFISNRQHGHKHVFRMALDGTHVAQLTGGQAEEAAPSYTADGQILFSSNRTGTWQVYRMRPDGTGMQALTNGDEAGNNSSPAAARDGSVVFVSDRTNDIKQLFVLRPDGKEAVQLTMSDRGENNTSPQVTDEMQIVYVVEREHKMSVWHMSMDGKGGRQFPIKQVGFVQTPAVIPSMIRDPLASYPAATNTGIMEMPRPPQNRLVYSLANNTEGGWVTHIYRMLFNGDDMQRLTDSGQYNGAAVVLKDGRIAYTSDRSGSLDIWLMNMDGNEQVNLTRQTGRYNSTR